MIAIIKNKLIEIQKQKTRLEADYNALSGAEKVLLQLLKELKSVQGKELTEANENKQN